MALQPITHRSFAEQDRTELQELIVKQVEQDPEFFLKKYEQSPNSFSGKYICSDLFKEMFPEYTESKDTRARYNAVVHNSAAVLAAEQFRRVINDPMRQGDEVIFLTGAPGAGKTSSVSAGGQLPPNCRAIFEGQLSRPETAIPKIQEVLNAGLKPVIVAVHTTPEQALANTMQRFERTGRGASVALIADIQGNLPDGLAAIRQHFEEAVELAVYDYTDRKNPTQNYGWENAPILQREGNYEQIKQRLSNSLEQLRNAGEISGACYEQANGRIPQDFSRAASLGQQSNGRHQENERGRGIQGENSQQATVGELYSTISHALESGREGKAPFLAILKEVGQTNDLDLILKVEAFTLQNEREKYEKEDMTVLPSLNAAVEDFSVITSAVKVVRTPEAYKAAATYHTKKAVRGVVTDGCHEALNSHIARLGNRMRAVGISVPEKNILRQRQTNMRTAKELYIDLQREALRIAPPEKDRGISR